MEDELRERLKKCGLDTGLFEREGLVNSGLVEESIDSMTDKDYEILGMLIIAKKVEFRREFKKKHSPPSTPLSSGKSFTSL